MTPVPVSEAIQQVGSVTRLSRILGVTRTSIYRWVKAQADLPELYAFRYRESGKSRRRG